jgi:hypothetical protein
VPFVGLEVSDPPVAPLVAAVITPDEERTDEVELEPVPAKYSAQSFSPWLPAMLISVEVQLEARTQGAALLVMSACLGPHWHAVSVREQPDLTMASRMH